MSKHEEELSVEDEFRKAVDDLLLDHKYEDLDVVVGWRRLGKTGVFVNNGSDIVATLGLLEMAKARVHDWFASTF